MLLLTSQDQTALMAITKNELVTHDWGYDTYKKAKAKQWNLMNLLTSGIARFYMKNMESDIFLLIINTIYFESKKIFYLKIVHMVDLLYYQEMHFRMHFKLCIAVSL